MAECANCENQAATGSDLCHWCEKRWMRERNDVVELAEHLTERNAQFASWCEEHGQPYP